MNITPETVKSRIKNILSSIYEADYFDVAYAAEEHAAYDLSEETIKELDAEMREAAKRLEFEKAAQLRDRIKELKEKMLRLGIKGMQAVR
jgi:excinuclease ABC subunit B